MCVHRSKTAQDFVGVMRGVRLALPSYYISIYSRMAMPKAHHSTHRRNLGLLYSCVCVRVCISNFGQAAIQTAFFKLPSNWERRNCRVIPNELLVPKLAKHISTGFVPVMELDRQRCISKVVKMFSWSNPEWYGRNRRSVPKKNKAKTMYVHKSISTISTYCDLCNAHILWQLTDFILWTLHTWFIRWDLWFYVFCEHFYCTLSGKLDMYCNKSTRF